MMKQRAIICLTFVLIVLCIPVFGDDGSQESSFRRGKLQGYAGPGWSVLFGPGGTGEMASLGPVMFRISPAGYLGPIIAYEESASEGPGVFLGGIKAEGYLDKLSRGFYSTSAGISILAGAAGLNSTAEFAARINGELNANFHLLPSLCLAVGPMFSLRYQAEDFTVLPGFTFALKEGTVIDARPLIPLKEGGIRVGGYWQGLWIFTDGEAGFIDGGGTRLRLPSGLAFGITGGVLRQRIEKSGSDLAIMLTGVTAEWNRRLTSWFTVSPRVTTGLAMYGWQAPDGTMDGGPHFMIRPELSIYLGILPFMEIGGGVGCNIVAGETDTTIPLDQLSSVSFSLQARVGDR
jgi:hypothetical protein